MLVIYNRLPVRIVLISATATKEALAENTGRLAIFQAA